MPLKQYFCGSLYILEKISFESARNSSGSASLDDGRVEQIIVFFQPEVRRKFSWKEKKSFLPSSLVSGNLLQLVWQDLVKKHPTTQQKSWIKLRCLPLWTQYAELPFL